MDESDPLTVDVDMYITVTILTDITSIQCHGDVQKLIFTNFSSAGIPRFKVLQFCWQQNCLCCSKNDTEVTRRKTGYCVYGHWTFHV